MKIRSLLLRTLLLGASLFFANVAQAQRSSDGLTLFGKTRKVKIELDGKAYVNVTIELDLEFSNRGSKPIIFLQPQDGHPAEIFWLGGISLSLAKFLAARNQCGSFIWNSGIYPALSTAREFTSMAQKLDQPSPPPGLTRILQPNERSVWQTNAFLRFYARTPASVYSQHDLDWETIRQIQTPLWMRLNFVVWSHNLQRADSGLRKRLQRRWKNLGLLNIDPDLTSEPIEVRLNEN